MSLLPIPLMLRLVLLAAAAPAAPAAAAGALGPYFFPVLERVENPSCAALYKTALGLGFPCLPKPKQYPYGTLTLWRQQLGRRILAALASNVISEEACGGFESSHSGVSCLKAFDLPSQEGIVGFSYGAKIRDLWSERLSNRFGITTHIYECNDPGAQLAQGRVPNNVGKGGCETNREACYEAKYEFYKLCLDTVKSPALNKKTSATKKSKKSTGLVNNNNSLSWDMRFQGPLSAHVKINVSGDVWNTLTALIRAKGDLEKIRTLDVVLRFAQPYIYSGFGPSSALEEDYTEKRVWLLEKLLQDFKVVATSLEAVMLQWIANKTCKEGWWCDEPLLHAGGAPLTELAVSLVNRAVFDESWEPSGAAVVPQSGQAEGPVDVDSLSPGADTTQLEPEPLELAGRLGALLAWLPR